MELYDLPVVLKGKVYVKERSNGTTTVCVYTPDHDLWDILPPPRVQSFTIATLTGQLVLVGGEEKSTGEVSNKIAVWDSQSRMWVHPYPPKTTAQVPVALEYGGCLIVAGGLNSESQTIPDVNILYTTRDKKWLTTKSLPITGCYWPVLIEDTLYLVGDKTRVILRAHIPTLISQALSAIRPSSQNAWESLPNAPFYYSSPVAVDNMLLTVGGSTNSDYLNPDPTTSIQLYNPTNNEWTRVGDLPEALINCNCTVLSGELLILGGWNRPFNFASSVYAANVSQN